MSDEILSMLGALGNHRELIRDSALSPRGEVLDLPEHQGAIRTLKKHSLIRQMGGQGPMSLSRPLRSLLSGPQRASARRNAAAVVANTWEEIENTIANRNQVLSTGDYSVAANYEDEIHELAFDLAEHLHSSLQAFAGFVDHDYATHKDLDVRIAENERAITMAKKLNDSLVGLDVHDLTSQARLNLTLRETFADLRREIASIGNELVDILHRMGKLLTTLQRDSATLRVHRALEVKLESDPQFLNELALPQQRVPPAIQFVGAVTRRRHITKNQDERLRCLVPDVYRDVDHGATIASMEQALKRVAREEEVVVEERRPVTDVREQVSAPDVEHPVTRRAREFVAALEVSGKGFSLRQAQERLEVACRPSLWVAAVLHVISSRPLAIQQRFDIKHDEVRHRQFSGNWLIRDITVKYNKPGV